MIPAYSPTLSSSTISFKIFEDYTILSTTETYILIKTDLVDAPDTNENSI